MIYLTKKNYSAAVISFETAIKIDSTYTDAYYYKGLAKQFNKDTIGAFKDYERAAAYGNINAKNALKDCKQALKNHKKQH